MEQIIKVIVFENESEAGDVREDAVAAAIASLRDENARLRRDNERLAFLLAMLAGLAGEEDE